MGLFSSIKDNLSNAYSVISRPKEAGNFPIFCHPIEDFRNGSILQVGEDDAALFYGNGKVEAVFTGGRHPLTTSNYPFLDNLRASFSGGVNSYQYRVFFINTKPLKNLRWGTQSPIKKQFMIKNPDPDIPPSPQMLEIQVRVNYTVQIVEPKLFLEHGSEEGTVSTDMTKDDLNDRIIRPMVGESITTNVVNVICSLPDTVFDIAGNLDLVSKRLEERLDDDFAEYGMRLNHFYTDAIDIVETPAYLELVKARTEYSTEQSKRASKTRSEMFDLNKLGNNWQRIQARDIMQKMAENPGAGGIAATGAGLGMGMVAGGVMGNMAAAMFSPMQAPLQQPQPSFPSGPSRFAPKTEPQQTATPASASVPQALCPHCGEIAGSGKFCGNCGRPLPQNITCPGCGENVPAGFKFCPNCGAKVC